MPIMRPEQTEVEVWFTRMHGLKPVEYGKDPVGDFSTGYADQECLKVTLLVVREFASMWWYPQGRRLNILSTATTLRDVVRVSSLIASWWMR